MAETILELRNLSKFYTGNASVTVGLNDVSLSFAKGEFIAVTGESGSGKSTMAQVLGGILPYESGELLYCGHPTSHFEGADWESYRRDNIGYISQSYGILPGTTVLENVVSALRLTGIEKEKATEKAKEILEEVELSEFANRRAAKLSSGQKQRLSIARALAKPVPVLIADEPTGNLDSENSAKVIELLAKAAKDRLVILITHEFSEAENDATRRIALQNGQVVLDTKLRDFEAPAEPEEDETPAAKKPARKKLSGYVARLLRHARPIWCIVMTLFFLVTAFSIFAFFGTFIRALDDTPTRIYDNAAFRNGDPCRIAITRADGGDFTAEDWDKVLSARYAEKLERYGLIADINYGYREGIDYRVDFTLKPIKVGDGVDYIKEETVTLLNSNCFMQTVPMLSEDGKTERNAAFLKAGRLPEAVNEVAAVGDESLLGSEITVYIRDLKNWSSSQFIQKSCTVVGVTDYGEGLYFSDTLAEVLTASVLGEKGILYGNSERLILGNRYIQVNKLSYLLAPADPGTIQDGEIRPEVSTQSDLSHKYILQEADPTGKITERSELYYYPNGEENEKQELWMHEANSSTLKSYVEVPDAMYELLAYHGTGGQVSLTIEDYAYTGRVLKTLQKDGFAAISPYQRSSNTVDPDLAAERKQTLVICLSVFLVTLLLQFLVVLALYSAETEDYKLLANIGLSYRTAAGSVLRQTVLFALLGELICVAAIGVMFFYTPQLLPEIVITLVKNLTWPLVALLWGIHFISALLAALIEIRVLNRRVFPYARRETDLDWTEWEADTARKGGARA